MHVSLQLVGRICYTITLCVIIPSVNKGINEMIKSTGESGDDRGGGVSEGFLARGLAGKLRQAAFGVLSISDLDLVHGNSRPYSL